ncbi:FAR1-related sequence 5-like protein [Tanacetum coccineum]
MTLDVQIVRVKDHVGYYIVDDDGNRTWYLDNDIGDKPLEGCQFVSIDQAYAFYKDYEGKNPEPAADKSKDVISDVSEITTDENVIVKQTRNRGSSRCGCLAKIRIKKFEGNLYRVYTFIEGHNHPLVAEKDMIYMKSSRDLGYTKQHFLFQASNANFGPSTGFRLLKQMCGGFDRVGATVVDCKNQKKKMNLFIGDRDAQMAVEKLLSRKLHSPGFYVNYKLGDDDKLVGLFWADEQAIRDYAVFGDIVSFDATFRSNKYITILASSLLSNETVGAYKWLLEEFKNAFGKDLNVVITDQDPSTKIAILECFPNTRHRLCMRHIMQKLVTKVGTAICSKADFKRRICDIVWTDQILPYEFEREWEIMIKYFQLDDNKWLRDMFDIRESWIPAFFARQGSYAGLMRTTSRSESENHFFGKWTSPHLTLVEFLSHYDTDIEYQRYKMVFVPFTGINHHNHCITFAAGLLSDEIVGAYKWLLEEFKNSFGKDPNVVITDQDPSMKIAIPECFPNSRHRLCMWHIMQKLVTKVGAAICNKTDFKRRICDIVGLITSHTRECEDEFEGRSTTLGVTLIMAIGGIWRATSPNL